MAHLSNGRVNISLLRDDARRLLLDCLDKCPGSKALFWDEKLSGPFGLIAEYVLLQEHEVTKMFQLQPNRFPPVDAQNIIFIVRPKLMLMDIIADYILKVEGMRGPKKEFHIFFVPRKSELCQEKLSERGVCANIIEYTAELFPVDSDVLSMEWETSFKECYIDNDMTSMYYVAKSLMTIQSIYGIIPNIYGKGKCAKHVFDLMTRMRRELSGNDPQITPQIDCLLLLDRSVDLVSVLATQLTYEGLLDENFGINNNTIELPPEKFCKPGEGGLQEIPTEPKRLLLNSGEELFAELRDKNFNAVGPTLSKKAKVLSAQFDERHGAKTIDAIKQFVDKLPHMQAAKKSLATHTSMAELIKEIIDSEMFLNSLQTEQEFMNGLDTDKTNAHIEDCIAREEPFIKVLRLICLQSLTNNGLKPKQLDYYKREIIQTYGYQHCLTLNNLEKAELLKVQGNRTYSVIRKTLRLIVDDVNEQSPSDISYVHSGYAPLSVRLAQFLTQPGWRAIPDVLNILPGPTIEGVQKIPLGLRKRRGSGSSIQSSTEEQKVTLVFFLGGCTVAEISALRFLSQQDDSPIEYIIATTKLVNGRTFLENLQEVVKVPAG
ncbi:vacuolar protein sorting-associated protein 33A [Parasteatoda tepidariorum]|uniref:vacuolar protein sorting-associated protein 33A n=1 Tax=Parasteatoda tepidariorum TaxID=114398 RepID=UPI00077FCC0B|nr:vacuolar protein sorting-associated protein 33A [Parasteatoda tepidariorum]